MSLQAKIEAVIYASEEPVTLQQLAGLLGEEAGAELDRIASEQGTLPLEAGAAARDGGEAPEKGADGRDAAGEPEQVASAEPLVDENSGASGPLSGEVGAVAGEAVSYHAAEAADSVPIEAADGAADSAEFGATNDTDSDKRRARERERAVRDHIRRAVDQLIRDYGEGDRGIEIREVASGYRMATKPEYHDAVRGFVKSLKPALKLTLPALETLAVVAYKQPVTAAEISEIRGVDSAGVLGGLLARKLIATAGRKQVIGRPMLYRTTRDFLLRFGLKDVNELPSMDEFERMAGELVEQDDLPMEHADVLVEQANARGDAEHIREVTGAEPSGVAIESDDTDESNDALEAKTAALSSDETALEATAETAAGGNDGRSNEPAAAAPLHTTETSEPAPEQASESSAAGPSDAGAEEGKRGSRA